MKKACKTAVAPGGVPQPLRALLVDDSALLLSHLSQILDAQGLVLVVGTAADGREALDKADALEPDLVLMDLHMPHMNGLQATAILRRRLPGARIIIMTLDETPESEAAARAHGAHGFVGKTRMAKTLTPEIRRVFSLNGADEERDPA